MSWTEFRYERIALSAWGSFSKPRGSGAAKRVMPKLALRDRHVSDGDGVRAKARIGGEAAAYYALALWRSFQLEELRKN